MFGSAPQYDTNNWFVHLEPKYSLKGMPLEQRVKKLISRVLLKSVSEIKNSSNFVRDLGADHSDSVELVTDVEEEFNIEIPDEEAEKFHTVQDLITYLKGRVND